MCKMITIITMLNVNLWLLVTMKVQSSADLVNVNLVKKLDLVKILMSPILLLIWSKITVDLVKNPDLVKILAPPKTFTKSALYCTRAKKSRQTRGTIPL